MMKSILAILTFLCFCVFQIPIHESGIPVKLSENEILAYQFLLSIPDSSVGYPDLLQNVMQHIVRANTIEVYEVELPHLHLYSCLDSDSEVLDKSMDNMNSIGMYFYPFVKPKNRDSCYCRAVNKIMAPVFYYLPNKTELLKIRSQSIDSSNEFLESISSLEQLGSEYLMVYSSFSKLDTSSTGSKRNLYSWGADLIESLSPEEDYHVFLNHYESSGNFFYENPEFSVEVLLYKTSINISSFGNASIPISISAASDSVLIRLEMDEAKTGINPIVDIESRLFVEEVNSFLSNKKALGLYVKIRNLSTGSSTRYTAGLLL